MFAPRILTPGLIALAVSVGPAAAQSVGDAAAYTALVLTPTAGVAPAPRAWMTDQPQRTAGIGANWGHIAAAGGNIDTFVADVTIPFTRGDVALQMGYLATSCAVCEGHFVAGATVEGSVYQLALSEHARFGIGLRAQAGVGVPSGGTLWSGTFGIPLSLSASGSGQLRIVPFVTPAIGVGRVSGGGDSETGSRFMLSGGIGLLNIGRGINLHVGVHKVFIDRGKAVFGAGIGFSPT